MSTQRRTSYWIFIAVGLVVALALAGFLSFYASGSPDGLNKVAEDKGFSSQEEESATADSPFAGYETAVDNDRLSGGLAGVVGVVVVLVVAGGVAFALRRRGGSGSDAESEANAAQPQASGTCTSSTGKT